jgi:glycosyltransferase involved in cell wall biosynthesis
MHRILIPTHEFPPFAGGIGRLIHGLATGAVEQGYDTHVLAPDFGEDTSDWDGRQPYELTRFGGGQFRAFRDLLPFTFRCRREIKRLRPSIIHAVDPAGQLSLRALSRAGLVDTYFFTVNGSELLVYRNQPAQRLWMRGAFSSVDAVCAISSATQGLLLELFDVSSSKVFVSNPGIDPIWTEQPVSAREVVRQRWGIGLDDFVIVTVARRVPEKGHANVIEGLAKLPLELREKVVYVVVGSGPEDYARELEDRADQSSVRLRVVGYLADDDVVALYDASDAFIMLSWRTAARVEGFGLVYVEAGARGLPSIARDVGGVSDAVHDGQTGIVLSSDSQAQEVADAVVRLRNDAELRARLGKQAREFAASLTWRKNARETYDRFDEALKDGS